MTLDSAVQQATTFKPRLDKKHWNKVPKMSRLVFGGFDVKRTEVKNPNCPICEDRGNYFKNVGRVQRLMKCECKENK